MPIGYNKPIQKVVVGKMLQFSTLRVVFDRKPELVTSFKNSKVKIHSFKIIKKNNKLS